MENIIMEESKKGGKVVVGLVSFLMGILATKVVERVNLKKKEAADQETIEDLSGSEETE